MQVDDLLAACALVEVVDVLCGHRRFRRLSDGNVARVRLRLLREVGAPEVPGEHGVRVVVPRVDGRHVLRVHVLPQAGLGVAVGGDAAIRAHAGAGEDLDVRGVGEEGAGGVDGGRCGHGCDGTRGAVVAGGAALNADIGV